GPKRTPQASWRFVVGEGSHARLASPNIVGNRRSVRARLLLQLDRVAGGVGDPNLHRARTLHGPLVRDAALVQLGDCRSEVVDGDAIVMAGRVDARPGRRRVDEVQLLVAHRVPVPADARDLRSRLVTETEHVAIELDHRRQRRAVAVDGYVVEARHLHRSSCSMNSSRMPPGASTNAMRRVPNAPSTTAGPHTTV